MKIGAGLILILILALLPLSCMFIKTNPEQTETWSERNRWQDSNVSAERETGQPFGQN